MEKASGVSRGTGAAGGWFHTAEGLLVPPTGIPQPRASLVPVPGSGTQWCGSTRSCPAPAPESGVRRCGQSAGGQNSSVPILANPGGCQPLRPLVPAGARTGRHPWSPQPPPGEEEDEDKKDEDEGEDDDEDMAGDTEGILHYEEHIAGLLATVARLHRRAEQLQHRMGRYWHAAAAGHWGLPPPGPLHLWPSPPHREDEEGWGGTASLPAASLQPRCLDGMLDTATSLEGGCTVPCHAVPAARCLMQGPDPGCAPSPQPTAPTSLRTCSTP